MKKYLPWILIVAALLIVFLFMTYTPGTERSHNVILSSIDESGISGTAHLTEVDGQVRIHLDMEGETIGKTMPVHIHSGGCPGDGSVEYSLNSIVDGESTTTIDVTLDELRDGDSLVINAHESAENLERYVSCGELGL